MRQHGRGSCSFRGSNGALCRYSSTFYRELHPPIITNDIQVPQYSLYTHLIKIGDCPSIDFFAPIFRCQLYKSE